MGFRVNEEIEIGGTGVTLSRFYVTIGRETIRLKGNADNTYDIECIAKIYKNRNAYNNGKSPLDIQMAKETVPENALNGNLYRRIYNILKASYTETEDD